MNDKRKPIEERIAELFGKSAYRDIRDGVGGGFTLSLPAVAAQLGLIQQKRGEAVVMAMETYYGSTLIHERELRKAWDVECKRYVLEAERVILHRMAGALAIRKFAGIDYTATALEDYAWIVRARKDTLRDVVKSAESWMDELWMTGLADLKAAFRSPVVGQFENA